MIWNLHPPLSPFAAELAADELPAKATQCALEAVGRDANYIMARRLLFLIIANRSPLVPTCSLSTCVVNIMDAEGNRESLPFSVIIPGIDWFDRTKPKAAGRK